MLLESKITNIRAEDAFLLYCSRTIINKETADHINLLLQNKIDWIYLIDRVVHHRVLPLFFQSLRQNFLNHIPTAVMNKLRNDYEKIARRNLYLTAKLVQLIDFFETQRIPMIPYKGPALAFLAYGNICLRQFGDLDILVDRHDYLKVRDLLLACGYRLIADYDYECSLLNHSHRVCVDLHQGITPQRFPTHIDFQTLKKRLQAIPVAREKILTFFPEDMLIVLCIQLAKDSWGSKPVQLNKVCDVAELIRSHPGMDWKWIIKESGQLGCQGMLLVSLSVAHQLLDAPIPELRLRSPTQPALDILTTHINDKLIHQAVFGDAGQLSMERFHWKARERWRDKLYPTYHSLKLRMIPNVRDHAFLSIPESMSSLYYLIRPIRLLKDYGKVVLNMVKLKFPFWKKPR